jgi:homoserine dehydrogenase
LDVGGFDAGHKLLLLASIAYGIDAKPEDILIEGLEGITPLEIEFAQEFGYKLKLLTIAKNEGNEVELRVHLAYIKEDEMIAKIDGVMNGVSVIGDKVGETLYYGAGAGGDATASAVISDIIEIARNAKSSPILGFKNEIKTKLTLKKSDDIITKYYVRLQVSDEVGVLAEVSKIFGSFNISIEKMLQKPHDDDSEKATLLLSTHHCREKDLKDSIIELKKHTCILQQPFFIRIEE